MTTDSQSLEEMTDDYSEAEVEADAQDETVAFERPHIDHFGEPVELLVTIPTCDNGEHLVDLFAVCPRIAWAAQSPKYDFPRSGLAREGLANMLAHAQSLLPENLRIEIMGVFRPFEIQRQMYVKARADLKEKYPHWDEELLTEYINVFSAPPIRDTPPPHTTGGAVDLCLIDENGERLDMISPFEMGWDSAPMNVEGLSETARANRKMLADILLASGLTNFPGEWWHWSYGEPGWALRGGHECALYGAVPDDEIPQWQAPS